MSQSTYNEAGFLCDKCGDEMVKDEGDFCAECGQDQAEQDAEAAKDREHDEKAGMGYL